MDWDINLLRSIFTVLVFVAFIGVCIWAWSSKRKRAFEEAANLPFVEPDSPAAVDNKKDQKHE